MFYFFCVVLCFFAFELRFGLPSYSSNLIAKIVTMSAAMVQKKLFTFLFGLDHDDLKAVDGGKNVIQKRQDENDFME